MSLRWTDKEKDTCWNLYNSHGNTWDVISENLNQQFGNSRSIHAVRRQVTSINLKRSTPSKPTVSASPLSSTIKTVLVYADTHYPYADPYAVAIMLRIAKDVVPDMVVIAGDLFENFSASSYYCRLPANKVPHLNDEIDLVKNHLRILRCQHPGAKIHYLGGNHEDRLLRLLARNAPMLIGVHALQVPSLLGLDKLDIEYHSPVNSESYISFGNLLIGHFDRCYKHSAYTAKNLVADKGMSLIQAHTHRQGVYNVTWIKRQVTGVELGCLCNPGLGYKEDPNWQQGFAIVSFSGKHFSIQLISIIRVAEGYSFAIFNNKVYQMRHEDEHEGVFAHEEHERAIAL